MNGEICLTKEELEKAKKLAYENMEKDETDIGFDFEEKWITNPFYEVSARFEFADLDAMCKYYGKDNVYTLLQKLLAQESQISDVATEEYNFEEICPHCSHVNKVKWDGESHTYVCESCNERILLCSLCDMDNQKCNECPYELTI